MNDWYIHLKQSWQSCRSGKCLSFLLSAFNSHLSRSVHLVLSGYDASPARRLYGQLQVALNLGCHAKKLRVPSHASLPAKVTATLLFFFFQFWYQEHLLSQAFCDAFTRISNEKNLTFFAKAALYLHYLNEAFYATCNFVAVGLSKKYRRGR